MTLNGHFTLNYLFGKFMFKIYLYGDYGQRHDIYGQIHIYACWKFILYIITDIFYLYLCFVEYESLHKLMCFSGRGLTALMYTYSTIKQFYKILTDYD